MADWAPEHFVPVAGFLILALALLLFYFSAMRPRRGTTEWMGRIDRPRFAALRCGRLRTLDAPWGVLAAVCGASAAAAAVFCAAAARRRRSAARGAAGAPGVDPHDARPALARCGDPMRRGDAPVLSDGTLDTLNFWRFV